MHEGNVFLYGKCIGFIFERTFCIHKEKEKHFYLRAGGYPIAEAVLYKLKMGGVQKVRLIVKNTDSISVYEASIEDWLSSKLIEENGYEPQRCLATVSMEHIAEGELEAQHEQSTEEQKGSD